MYTSHLFAGFAAVGPSSLNNERRLVVVVLFTYDSVVPSWADTTAVGSSLSMTAVPFDTANPVIVVRIGNHTAPYMRTVALSSSCHSTSADVLSVWP